MKHMHPAGRQEGPPPGAQASSCRTDPSCVLGLGEHRRNQAWLWSQRGPQFRWGMQTLRGACAVQWDTGYTGPCPGPIPGGQRCESHKYLQSSPRPRLPSPPKQGLPKLPLGRVRRRMDAATTSVRKWERKAGIRPRWTWSSLPGRSMPSRAKGRITDQRRGMISFEFHPFSFSPP